MSKIYDALLRAELERANKTGSNNGVQTAEEIALAHTLDPYVPEPQPHFQQQPPLAPRPYQRPEETASFATAAYPLPLATEPPSLAPLPAWDVSPAATTASAAFPFPAHPPTSDVHHHEPSAYPLPPALEPASPVPLPVSGSVDTAATAGFDPNTVRLLPWNPVLERLPALAERGQSIEQFRSLRSRLAEFRDSNVPLKSLLITSTLR